MKNILMICVGNICRSPMAEGLLKHFSKEKGLGLQVHSAGIGALKGHPADPFAIEVMKQQGIDISQHRARQVTSEMLCEADLILVMEKWQQQEIGCIFPFVYGKVRILGNWSGFEVSDPYQRSLEEFEVASKLIQRGLSDWQARLWREHV